jgi:hypothetical protein
MGTNIINQLYNECYLYNIGNKDDPRCTDVTLTINVYPYVLSKIELKTMFSLLREILGITKILMINCPLKEFYPSLIKGKYNILVIYDFFNEWANYHWQALIDKPMIEVTVRAPILYLRGCEVEGRYPNIYHAERGFSSILDLELLDISDFCLCPSLK